MNLGLNPPVLINMRASVKQPNTLIAEKCILEVKVWNLFTCTQCLICSSEVRVIVVQLGTPGGFVPIGVKNHG
jgi:hypothetical protein